MNTKRDKNQCDKQLAWLLFLLVFMINACAGTTPDQTPYRFTLVGTADLQGALEPTKPRNNQSGKSQADQIVGGIARLGSMIRAIQVETGGHVAVVSTGDDLMNRYFHTFKGQAIFELMTKAGYDIYALGNHEFDKGPEVLSQALAKAKWQTLCTDLEVDESPLEGLCQPWLIREYDGLRVGFFSLMTEDFPLVTTGGKVKLVKSNVEATRWAVSELSKNGAELIIALTHIGFEQDQRLAGEIEGIDIIFGGHSHDYIPRMTQINRTVIVNGGEKGTHLVRLDIRLNASKTFDPNDVHYTLLPVTAAIAPDRAISARLEGYKKQFPPDVVLGRTNIAWDLTKEAVRRGESAVCNLVNDLMRQKFKADIVLNNGGAFRGAKIYPPGPLTDKMLKEIDEFSNYAFLLDIQGRHLKAILERSAACYDKGGFLHPSGIRYTIDLSQMTQEIASDGSQEIRVIRPGERVGRIRIQNNRGDWRPVQSDRTYRILTNSYIANQQGDGYFWFKRYGRNLKNTYSTFYSILAEAIGHQGVLNPGKLDQRVVVIDEDRE